jgi:hypothetical protein
MSFARGRWTDIGVPLLRNAFPGIDFSAAEIPVPTALAKKMGLENPALPLDGLITLGLGVMCTLIYWAPAAMEQKFLISNGMMQLAPLVVFLVLLIPVVAQSSDLIFFAQCFSDCVGYRNGFIRCYFTWFVSNWSCITGRPILL